MRPVRLIAAVVLTAAVAATGSLIARSTAHSSAAPAAPVAAAPATSLAPQQPVAGPQPPSRPTDPGKPVGSVPRPVLADGRYDAYIRRLEIPYEGGTGRLVADLVQVFEGQAAVDAAIADGMSRDQAQVLYTYIRNQNPRLRTLPLAGDVRLDLRGVDCEAPISHQLAKLAADARAMSGANHMYYFTLTVAGGAVRRVQEFVAINAC
jgi:hypothetical protein